MIWTCIYMFSTLLTSIALEHRLKLMDERPEELFEEQNRAIVYYWGTLLRSCLSLFEAIFNGADWDTMIWPLAQNTHIFVAILFLLFILFTFLAVLNLITGTFVDQALHNAAKEKERYFLSKTKLILSKDNELFPNISSQEFEARLEDPELQKELRRVGINPLTAPIAFQLLDGDDKGVLDIRDLTTGLLSLRMQASTMDIALVLEELTEMMRTQREELASLQALTARGSNEQRESAMMSRLSEALSR